MIQILLCALVTCVACLSLGQAALRICGAPRWSWMAAPVGISVLMLLAMTLRYVPGRVTTTGVVIAILTVASLVWCVRKREHRPPLIGLAMATPVALLALAPFVISWRAGTLGVSLDDDMSLHLLWVEGLISETVAKITPLPYSYPLGPHSVVAVLSSGLGIRVDLAFAGFTLALPLLTAWTALHLLRRPARWGQLLVATVVGMPYLVAAYFGMGAFKELLQAQLVLAIALWLEHPVPASGRWRWAPLVLLVAGTLSVYSAAGLLWPAAFIGLWLVGQAVAHIYRDGIRKVAVELRHQLLAMAVAGVILLLIVIPQFTKIKDFFLHFKIPKSNIGNLVGPLSRAEALGAWTNPSFDFRYPASPAFTGGMWTGFVLILVLFGIVWTLRRGRWMLPAAAGAAYLIWDYSARTQSPYVAAKALVILSPLLLILAALPLAERSKRMPAEWLVIAPILALVLFGRVTTSSLQALRFGALGVGPTNHLVQLRELRPALRGEPTLFLGSDTFIRWELAGVPVSAPVVGFLAMPVRPEKPWSYGTALDIDSVNTDAINAVNWVITTRDAAQSELPPQLHLVRKTADFELWHRTGVVAPRQILNEGQYPGANLDCKTPAGRALVRGGGKAAVRKPPDSFPVGNIASGATASVPLSLSPGAWDLELQYVSRRPLTVSAHGRVLRQISASLDWPGPRWPIGRIVAPPSGSVTVTIHANSGWRGQIFGATLVSIVATPVGAEHVVPLRKACRRYVDWYTTTPQSSKR